MKKSAKSSASDEKIRNFINILKSLCAEVSFFAENVLGMPFFIAGQGMIVDK